MVRLAVEGLRFSYSHNRILNGVTIGDMPRGSVTALVGPNAAGKTTLLKCVAGLLRYEGRVLLDGRELAQVRQAELSKLVGYLPQDAPVHAILTVFEAVLLARQHSFTWRVGEDDLALVGRTLRELEIEHIALRYLNELSGGQRQLVSVAQALVRRPDVLLLDEPTSSLDLQYQLEVLGLVRRFTRERGITTLLILHDLNVATRFADQFVVLRQGGVYAIGPPRDVLNPVMLRDVYGVHGYVYHDDDGVPYVNAISSLRNGASEASRLESLTTIAR